VTFRREIVSLLTVMAAALSVVAMFPFEAVAFKAVEPANTGATASFVVLSDEAESAALKTAKTSWQADRRALRSLRIDLAELELPEEKFEAVAMPGAFVSSAEFGIVDLSLAPTPVIGDSVGHILEEMGIEKVGCHGTTACLALLNDAVKKGGVMASSRVGGLSGAFIPVSEDIGMINAAREGALSLSKLEAMTAVCSVGIDMVAIPGDTPASTISAIIADEAAIGMVNNKTTAVRIIPVPGKGVGEEVEFGGLLGTAPIMAVSPYSAEKFISRGGSIPAPIHGNKN
jgi:hypothetical protein